MVSTINDEKTEQQNNSKETDMTQENVKTIENKKGLLHKLTNQAQLLFAHNTKQFFRKRQ